MTKYMLRRLGLASDSGYLQPPLQACLEAVLEQCAPLMEDVLGRLEVSLVPVLGQTSAATLDAGNRQTITLLCAQGADVQRSFAAHVRQRVFSGDKDAPAERPAMRFDDFQFLDATQIDANIAFAQSQQTVLGLVEESLPALNALMSRLLGWSSVQGHLNPLKPDVFVQALHATLEAFVPDRPARSAVLGLASGHLGVCLNRLYREVSDWLRTQGVEPVRMASGVTTGVWNPAGAKQSTVAHTLLTLDKLRRLLSGELDPNPAHDAPVDFAQTIPASLEALQDMRLVEPMVKRLSERANRAQGLQTAGPDAGVPDMLAAQDNAAQERRNLGEQLGREVVLLMLENLMRDRRLLPRVRDSLQALEPALIRLSQQDGRFFSERHHPARVLLDRITHRSLGFATEAAPGFARFQKYLDNAVSVLGGGAGDATAFARMLRKLDDAWAADEAEQQQRASEAARGLLRAEQRNLLAQRVARQFADRSGSMVVPDFAAAFLRGPWAQVVAEAQLHFADGTPDPGGYAELVDDLLWSLQLRLIRHNRGRLVQLVPDLLATLRRGLELISYPPPRIAGFFDALIAFHQQAFDSTQPTIEAVSPDAQMPPADACWVVQREAADSGYMEADAVQAVPEAAAPAAEPGQRADRRWWQVDKLAVGTWVDLAVGGQWLRAQLTWTSPQRTLYLFVAGEGSTHSVSRQTLEQMKLGGLVRMVSASRVMDNALDAVARTALSNDLQTSTQSKLPE